MTTAADTSHAGAGDAEALHELAAATFALACPPTTTRRSIEHFIATNLSVERFEAYLADPARLILLVNPSGAKPLGYAMLVFEHPSDPDVSASISARPTVELSKLYVRAEAHRAGIASGLVADAIAEAIARGCAGIWLGVNQQNERANSFYAKHGFDVVGTKRFLVGELWEDDFVRERILKRH